MTYRYFADRGGWRFIVVFHHGYKWIKALDISTFEVFRLPVSELSGFRPLEVKPLSLANRLKKRRATFSRCGVGFSAQSVKAAINILQSIKRKRTT